MCDEQLFKVVAEASHDQRDLLIVEIYAGHEKSQKAH